MNNPPRVILEHYDGTRIEGTLYDSNPLTGMYTLRLDNGQSHQAQGHLSLKTSEVDSEPTVDKKTLTQRIKTFFTKQ